MRRPGPGPEPRCVSLQAAGCRCGLAVPRGRRMSLRARRFFSPSARLCNLEKGSRLPFSRPSSDCCGPSRTRTLFTSPPWSWPRTALSPLPPGQQKRPAGPGGFRAPIGFRKRSPDQDVAPSTSGLWVLFPRGRGRGGGEGRSLAWLGEKSC